MKFYLGTHVAHWLDKVDYPLFISRLKLESRQNLPQATCDWALDSGAFSQLTLRGAWTIKLEWFIKDTYRFRDEIGRLQWAAPMDWMCEPKVLKNTGLTVPIHQKNTVDNFLALRQELGELVIPVLQGWKLDDYLRCVDMYDQEGVDLSKEAVVGVGSVCRRQGTTEVEEIMQTLAGLDIRLHGFGVKLLGLKKYQDKVVSSDSMAWSFKARYSDALPGCRHYRCDSCLKYATKWRDDLLRDLAMS